MVWKISGHKGVRCCAIGRLMNCSAPTSANTVCQTVLTLKSEASSAFEARKFFRPSTHNAEGVRPDCVILIIGVNQCEYIRIEHAKWPLVFGSSCCSAGSPLI